MQENKYIKVYLKLYKRIVEKFGGFVLFPSVYWYMYNLF